MRRISVSSKAILCILSLHTGIVRAGGARRRKDGVPSARDITVMNESGVQVDVFWIHPQTKELGPSNTEDKGVAYGASTVIASYITHSFEVQELAPCKNMRCRKGYFTVTSYEDQIATVNKDFSVDISDNKKVAKKQARKALSESCPIDYSTQKNISPMDQLEALSACLESQIKATVDAKENEVSFQAEIRQTLGSKLSDYACLDSKLNATKSFYNETLLDASKTYQKQVLFINDRDGQLSLVADLLSTDETTLLVEKLDDDDKSSLGDIPVLKPALERLGKLVRTTSGTFFKLGELEKKTFHGYGECASVKLERSISSESCRSLDIDLQEDDELATDIHSTLLLFTGTGGSLHFTDIGVHVRPTPGTVLYLKYGQPDPSGKSGNIAQVKICFQDGVQEMGVLRSSVLEP